MDHSEGFARDPAVSQELLKEMLWVFRVEDASPWNYAILALAFLVFVISIVLLRRSIQANRNRKMLPLEKQPPGALYLAEAPNQDDNGVNAQRETLLSEAPNSDQGVIELKERDIPSVLLPDPAESES
ncbi:organic solute transporter subunit beta [Echinops telfairi]|uniref:Organic solute transporter subunit beta n=5 Tax=Echinops telfairi TaxID=9371 RepID=A0AC55CNB3_ECHTE|nr:organic solute transporter subunit beta [Echinops telfairi]XP_045141686.1 organic solute transporter subunit beta [Echinops telfairi]XP_045141687.1 organic solute transporter subunit beta [Echinops telfairi]XP_045141688.1 organic solute transporter subunit beta [Echinops telfairi]XP_045141689.1 organic solute transporter subunit beta [Echinops telfairi]